MAKNKHTKQTQVEPVEEVEVEEADKQAPTNEDSNAEDIAVEKAQDDEELAKLEAEELEKTVREAQEAEEQLKRDAEAEELAATKAKAEEVSRKANKGNAKNLLLDSKATVADKVEYCLTVATGKVRMIANILESYNNAMKPGALHDEKLMVRKQYELVNLYRDVFSNEDYGTFKQYFDVINLFFNHYATEAFGEHYLYRFDYLWEWDDVELTTLLNVNEVISQLANYENRTVRLKQLNLEYALNPDETIITNGARDNIIRYYSV